VRHIEQQCAEINREGVAVGCVCALKAKKVVVLWVVDFGAETRFTDSESPRGSKATGATWGRRIHAPTSIAFTSEAQHFQSIRHCWQ